MTEKPTTELNWREEPRSAMIERVMVAVDCARGEAEAHGEGYFPRFVEEALFPFLENELATAELFEMYREVQKADEE